MKGKERTVIDELRERGFIHQVTETGIEDAARGCGLVVYCGFDPTSASLHVGHVVPIMVLAHVQRYGGVPIFLVGGATAQIGDPSGKQSERVLLSGAEIRRNAESVRKQLHSFLRFDGEHAALLLDNAAWLEGQTLISFLRDTAKHFSLGYMLAKESVRSRLDREQGISVTEFLYGLLQAYDFGHLSMHYGCNVQVGGSDQWGNIIAGVDYIRKTQGKVVHGLTLPLLTKSDGAKFGKTESGAVWLDASLTSPYQMYQYWMNTDDRDVVRFLKLFTFLSLEEIDAYEQKVASAPDKREAQEALAFEFTRMVHGAVAAKAAREASLFLFGNESVSLDESALGFVLEAVPSFHVSVSGKSFEEIDIVEGVALTGLAKSKSDARKVLAQGGVYVNNVRQEENRKFTKADLLHGKAALLRTGKKRYAGMVV